MSELSIVLLGPGPGFSGRAVKLQRIIGMKEKDEAFLSAAREAGEDSRRWVFLRLRESAMRMIRAITDPGLKSMNEVRALPVEKWQTIGLGDLDNEGSARHHSKIFTPKDWDVLFEIYRRSNEASAQEIEAILGGELLVSEG